MALILRRLLWNMSQHGIKYTPLAELPLPGKEKGEARGEEGGGQPKAASVPAVVWLERLRTHGEWGEPFGEWYHKNDRNWETWWGAMAVVLTSMWSTNRLICTVCDR